MEKIPIVLIVILVAVAISKSTLFDSNGVQKDVADTKTNTSAVMQSANTIMKTMP